MCRQGLVLISKNIKCTKSGMTVSTLSREGKCRDTSLKHSQHEFGWKAFWEQDRWKAGTDACLVVTGDDGDREATST